VSTLSDEHAALYARLSSHVNDYLNRSAYGFISLRSLFATMHR
jgi:hypothetical protein